MELTSKRTKTLKRADKEALIGFGLHLKELREAKGLTQLSLSFSAQVSPHYLSDLENGRRNPSFVILRRLSSALGIRLSELLDY